MELYLKISLNIVYPLFKFFFFRIMCKIFHLCYVSLLLLLIVIIDMTVEEKNKKKHILCIFILIIYI